MACAVRYPTFVVAGNALEVSGERTATEPSHRPGPASKPHDFQAPTNLAAVVNEIVAVIVRLHFLKLHRSIAIDASHEIQQRATIVIHMCCPAKQWFGLKLPRPWPFREHRPLQAGRTRNTVKGNTLSWPTFHAAACRF
jgi:hypothetical protein